MQIQLQAFGRTSVSLRKRIADDLSYGQHDILYVQAFKDPARPSGWAKIKGQGLPGAINLEWDASANMLLARAITRKGNRPHALLGVFLEYLIERHGKKIASINIQLR